MLATVKLGRHHMRHALAAHLRIAAGFTVHPPRHDMTANARCSLRAFGQFCRCIMRTPRTEIGRALGPWHVQQNRRLFSQRTRFSWQVFIRKERIKPFSHDRHQGQRA